MFDPTAKRKTLLEVCDENVERRATSSSHYDFYKQLLDNIVY